MSKTTVLAPSIEMVHCIFVDGKAQFSTYISTETDDDLFDAARMLEDDDFAIEVKFTLDGAVNDSIENHRRIRVTDKVLISADERPFFESMRAQLVAAMAAIDAIEWLEE